MNKKIFIIGSRSCLAKHIIENLNDSNYVIKSISRTDFDYINNFANLSKIISKFKPKFIVNCAAMSNSTVCEKSPSLAYDINAYFPLKVAELCKRSKIILIHFSTDAVFDGTKINSYTIKDIPNPISIYSKSKRIGELLISNFDNVLIIRLSILYGKYHKKQTIGKLINNLKKGKNIYASKDIFKTPTNSNDVAIYLRNIIDRNNINFLLKKKIIHLSDNKNISIYEFMLKISKFYSKPKYVSGVLDSFFKKKIFTGKNLGLRCNVNNFQTTKFKNSYKDL